ncbi:MAG: chromosome segregation protein SMC [Bryobacteraceae bacterium]|nr:chromosome segregation protein SMC [Bryobacteraceae bacterium]
MLILKRIEIQGFKSFCDRTEMRFSGSGLAAVVGPNGCGKSNLSDAITWVLGEQSAKSLRGARMEDVIFAGTRDRKPVGMAQVTMTLVDPEGRTVIPGARPETPKPGKNASAPAPSTGQTPEVAASAESAIVTEKIAPAEFAAEQLRIEHLEQEPAISDGGSNGHSNGHTNGNGITNGNGLPAVPDALKPRREQEIIVTRRLFRSGDSEYLINGRQARLRDIQDIFMGTGLGPESYAIIEQGRIGQILSSKPLDRRGMIEEAAGISRFKTKKRLAEAKLEGARQNLTRVFDILEEVGRQVNSLKRQAGKARRYQELKAELDSQLRLALTGRYYLLAQEAESVADQLHKAARECQELQTAVEAGEKSLASAREQAYQTAADLTESRKRLAEIRVEFERTRGQIDSQAKQAGSMEQRLQQGETEIGQTVERLKSLEQEREHLRASFAELQNAGVASRERLQAKTAERDELQNQLRERERGLESSRQQVVRMLGEVSALRNQLGQIDAYLASMDRDTARVGKDEESASAELERLEGLRTEVGGKLAERQLEVESLATRRKQVDADLQSKRAAAQQTRRDLDTLRNETQRVRARRDSLDEILQHRAYANSSVKRLFTAIEKNQAKGLKPVGVLADFIELKDPRFERATEEFLHEELEYVVVRDWNEAQQGVDLLRGELDGRASFLVEPDFSENPADVHSAPVPEPPIGPETGLVGRLCDGIRFTNGLTNAPTELLPRLARCYQAESRASAERLAFQYPDLYFLLDDGVCYHGHAMTGGKRATSGPLALKRELRELSALFEKKQVESTAAQVRVETLEKEIQLLSDELETVRTELQKQEKETLLLDQEMRKIAEESKRANQKLSASRMELERLTRDASRSREERERKLALAAEKEQARGSIEAALEEGRSELEEFRSRVALLSEEHSVLRVELAGLEERRRGLENAVARLDQQTREVLSRRENLTREMERVGIARTRLLENNLELDQRSTTLQDQKDHFEKSVATLSEREAVERASLAAGDEELKRLRQSAAVATEARSQVELELVRRQSELKFLDETSRKDLSIPVAELAAEMAHAAVEAAKAEAAQAEAVQSKGVEAPAAEAAEVVGEGVEGAEGVDAPVAEAAPASKMDELAVVEAEERVVEIRKRIEALGAVNPEAWQEYQESQQRYDFLNAQRQDLLDSIRDTEKAINEIDTESRKRFAQAFEVINQNFRNMFKKLFGGGLGEMRLTGEGDALDQGIEIVAQPPGKRLQNVLLLSGGEKAMTAMGLLMGIFQYQPSPFCILDEVDAPLDEANTGRFTQLIKDMAAQTQFIVITHAKKTMEAAEGLYGVTMQEQGVSKLVSVRLSSAPPPPPVTASLQTAPRA